MEALRAFAESVGYKGDIMDGVVTQCAGGAIVEIHWKSKDLDGTLPVGDLNIPKLRVLDLNDNKGLKGDVGKLVLPEGTQTVNFQSCEGLTGTLVALPPSIKTFDIGNTGVKIDVTAIEWPANATALVYQFRRFVLMCRTTADSDESAEGAETSEICIRLTQITGDLRFSDACNTGQVIGNIGQLNLPVGMKSVDFRTCYGLTGNIAHLNLPVDMQTVNFHLCDRLTGDVGKLVLPEGIQTVNFGSCEGLTGDVGNLVLPDGMQRVIFQYCKGLTGRLPASERAKVRTYTAPPTHKHECARFKAVAAAAKEEKEAEAKAWAAVGGGTRGRRDGAAGGGGNGGKVKKIGRNETCPCGGGKKYKKCCGAN
jgi:hypothetical protein